jgi:activator of HSP90 ATPase
MNETLELSEIFNVGPDVLYAAWLSSDLHTKMTGGVATCGNKVGDAYSAWDGYISGENVELVENEKIVQTWRTSEFAESDEDSMLTITFSKVNSNTELKLQQTNIPEGQTQYEKGWVDHYFTPMKAFFKSH